MVTRDDFRCVESCGNLISTAHTVRPISARGSRSACPRRPDSKATSRRLGDPLALLPVGRLSDTRLYVQSCLRAQQEEHGSRPSQPILDWAQQSQAWYLRPGLDVTGSGLPCAWQHVLECRRTASLKVFVSGLERNPHSFDGRLGPSCTHDRVNFPWQNGHLKSGSSSLSV